MGMTVAAVRRTAVLLAHGLVALSLRGQTDVRSFQWGTNTYGLYFADTSLTAPVKSAIRDDISRTLSECPSNDMREKIYKPSDEQYGTYAGHMWLVNGRLVPKGIRSWKYKVFDGTRHLCVETNLTARYIEQIALTNQYAVDMVSLSNFIHTVQNATTNTVSYDDFQAWWWSPRTDAELPPDEIRQSDYLSSIAGFSQYRYATPSILEFQHLTLEQTTAVFCEVRSWKPMPPFNVVNVPFLYKGGRWRIMAMGDM